MNVGEIQLELFHLLYLTHVVWSCGWVLWREKNCCYIDVTTTSAEVKRAKADSEYGFKPSTDKHSFAWL